MPGWRSGGGERLYVAGIPVLFPLHLAQAPLLPIGLVLDELSIIEHTVSAGLLASIHACIQRSTSLLSQAEERPCSLTGGGKVPSLMPA